MIALALEFLASVDMWYTLPYPPVARTVTWPVWALSSR
jgi:hypothetical protein